MANEVLPSNAKQFWTSFSLLSLWFECDNLFFWYNALLGSLNSPWTLLAPALCLVNSFFTLQSPQTWHSKPPLLALWKHCFSELLPNLIRNKMIFSTLSPDMALFCKTQDYVQWQCFWSRCQQFLNDLILQSVNGNGVVEVG